MSGQLRAMARYASRLPGYLRRPLSARECERMIEKALACRESAFLDVLRRGVFDNPNSPYRRLLAHMGADFSDVAGMVRREGIEGALEELYRAGVYVTAEEFKGRRPIERPGFRLEAAPALFDNPLLARDYEGRSSGSRGAGTRVIIDLDLLVHETAVLQRFLAGFELTDRPYALWRMCPPVAAGMKSVLRHAKLGRAICRWFTPRPVTLRDGGARFALFTAFTVWAGRGMGLWLPWPEHVPLTAPERVTRWLARQVRAGRPAVLDSSVSPAVRVCLAARERGMDISGTFFRVGGEPLTEVRAAVIASAGCRAACNYSMTEVGMLGTGCTEQPLPDDVHVLTHKVALVQPAGVGRLPPGALVATTLMPSCPKLMINVETGDFGTLERRACGCPLGKLGLGLHLSGIRSYEKLTGEGVTFLGTELLRLLDEVLPARFGGGPTDYQLLEEDEGGIPRVSIVARPRLGPICEREMIRAVVESLGRVPGGTIMADHWRAVGTLRLVRREPDSTGSGKVQALACRPTTRPN